MIAKPQTPITANPFSAFPVPPLAGGILLTFLLALLGWTLSLLPGLDRLGALACTLFLATLYRHLFHYPEALRPGIRLSSGTLLRAAIVLFGLKLNVSELLGLGLPLLARSAGTIAFALAAVLLLGRLFKADRALTLLLAIGTGICGAAAIAAVSPIIRSKDEDTAIGAGLIALLGTAFAALYTLLQPWLPMDPSVYGIWSGLTLHEVAHVAMAASAGGPDALAEGLLAKLCRVFLLLPVCLMLAAWMKRKHKDKTGEEAGTIQRFPFPWFLLGFVAMSLVGSYLLPNVLDNPAPTLHGVSLLTTLLLAMAMAGLGLNVSLRDLRSRALRPLAAMAVASAALSTIVWFTL
ncbi:YeiH family protein [Cohnella faecalis]|uniref:Putative sulfate exporter family transporter n=1 Tax=Cohnella faecalis TaxID=2315694 RepID=A0A398CIP1_9BACL|nr:putative sulfate exporter family transporter [Cohnella faecalis]RIE01942.1 putative sulfate exporter family transporter [Cohnella faecalis]